METRCYDLVVIGSGASANAAAFAARDAGCSVALIDSRPFGGTCQLRGCDPKKVLLAAAEAVAFHKRALGCGLAGNATINWADLMRFKRSFTESVPARRATAYADKGIDAVHGQASFTAPDAVRVNDLILKARNILIAAGARPVTLPIPGAEHLVTSDSFLEMPALPERIVMVGGGYIAAEFSHLAACAGAQVTILQRGPRMLTAFDPDLVAMLMPAFRRLYIDVRTHTEVEAIERTAGGFAIHASGQPRIEADLVVHAAGRAPDFDALDLNAAGVARDAKGHLRLNAFLQSESNPLIYAAGDAAGQGPPLTPIAGRDGTVAATNILRGNTTHPDYRAVPSVAFTIPPLAGVGLSEQQAHDSTARVRVNTANAGDWYTPRRVHETVYGYKVLVDADSDRILGAHLVGPHADEVINVFAVAIRHGLTATQLGDTVFAYPTGASDVSYML